MKIYFLISFSIFLIHCSVRNPKAFHPNSDLDQKNRSGAFEEDAYIHEESSSSIIKKMEFQLMQADYDSIDIEILKMGFLNASLSLEPCSTIRYTVSESQILIHDKIYLYDSKRTKSESRKYFFFVFHENILDFPFVSIRYKHETFRLDQKGVEHALLSFADQEAFHEAENKRWIISLDFFFEKIIQVNAKNSLLLKSKLHAEDIHQLSLEVVALSCPIFLMKIRFHAIPPLAEIINTKKNINFRQSIYDCIEDESRKILVYQEEIENPAHYAVSLWIRVPRKNKTLTLETQFVTSDYVRSAHDRPQGPINKTFFLKAKFTADALYVEDENKKIKNLVVKKNGWYRVSLEAHEKCTFFWFARPVDGMRDWILPLPTQKTFFWKKEHPQTYREVSIVDAYRVFFPKLPLMTEAERREKHLIADPVRPPDCYAEMVNTKSELSGWRMTGEWSRTLRVAHPFVEEIDALENEDYQDLGIANYSKKIDIDLCAGEIHSHAKKFEYQFIFR